MIDGCGSGAFIKSGLSGLDLKSVIEVLVFDKSSVDGKLKMLTKKY